MSILKPKDIDVSRIKYSEAKQNAAGGRTVYINYTGDDGRDGNVYSNTNYESALGFEFLGK